MNKKDLAIQNKQRERQARGENFQEEIRRSWARYDEYGYRIRLKDGAGGTQPADELVLLPKCNIMSELKRTAGTTFNLSFLRSDQASGLISFENCLPQNIGIVMISFLNEAKGRDEAYAFRLARALVYMDRHQRSSIPLKAFQDKAFPRAELYPVESFEPHYDLKELVTCFESL